MRLGALSFAIVAFTAACSSSDDAAGPSSSGGPADGGPGSSDGGDGGGPSACAAPAGPATFTASASSRDPWVVAGGTLPPGVTGVEVNGATRGVRFDATRGVWSYVLQHDAGSTAKLDVVVHGAGGATETKTLSLTVGSGAPLAARALSPGKHTVGAWMFAWFTGDSKWDCVSPWRPAGGFVTWDGSTAWARAQILDQMDAHLDLVGVQFSQVAGGTWPNVVDVMKAVRELADEGYAPPRLFPFFDTIIWADRVYSQTNTPIDLASSQGRADFYENIGTFYATFATELGARDAEFAKALLDGKPFVAMWHSSTPHVTGVSTSASDADLNTSFFADLKSRFVTQHGQTPWIIAHPNNWRFGTGADEITLMFGPPTWFHAETYGTRTPTVNVEAGFWNPISNSFYLARDGGTHYADAWTSALAARATADHLYIDSWNETGEGSGIFDAQPSTYTASTDGPCNTDPWTYKRDDTWGTSARHYIDETRKDATAWNDVPDDDAEMVADDVPATMRPGERRWVSVVVRNRGDGTWTDGATPALAQRAESDDFGVKGVPLTPDDVRTKKFGGVIRGFPAVYTFEIVAPCTPGSKKLVLGLPFGDALSRSITVAP